MTNLPPEDRLATHSVENQPGPMPPPDLWGGDAPLRAAVAEQGGDGAALAEAAARLGTAEARSDGEEARRDAPRLVLFDRGGRRLDEVRFAPGYHNLMQAGAQAGYAAVAWEGRPGGHVTHAAMVYLLSQVEPGVCCPLTMTYAGVPALQADPTLAETWVPRLTARAYDPAMAPVGEKRAATLGMAMTEKQGGSDVRANTTRAERDGDLWRLTGHKWFCSAPMSDGFLTLAQTDRGLSCFLVPRWLEGGRNAIRLQRLKDKLGNRANASAEIEYQGAVAHLLGEEGQGVRTIIRMVHHTRLDTAMAPAGLMRAALIEALWWVEGRRAFQRRLIDQPLMRAVLADLALDWEGALAAGLRAARAFDGADEGERALARIAVALAKYVSNKRAVPVIGEAMEVLGGMGYVEDTPLPMLYREAPLNGIWEGSGNVICLDILRTLAREPLAAEALDAELDAAKGSEPAYDTALDAHRARWPDRPPESEARWFAESLGSLFAASMLIRTAPEAVAAGYAQSRLGAPRGLMPGAVAGLDEGAILGRLAQG
ncbi:MAG: acyl-CoA dehydrogenase family protein [Rhodosalinus sp.]|uniref:acyl-CoA dehydrogenase family protein n=1 Tax=Rhodosalinus sp. TaxID=2047741 RepID=UPI003979544A